MGCGFGIFILIFVVGFIDVRGSFFVFFFGRIRFFWIIVFRYWYSEGRIRVSFGFITLVIGGFRICF